MNEAIQVITALTGLIGATGGILISYLSLRHAYRGDRYIIKLGLRVGNIIEVRQPRQQNHVSDDMLIFSLVNAGKRDFQVVQIGLKIGRWKGLIINNPVGSVTLPYVLKPDKTCDFWTEYASVKDSIKKPALYNKIKIRAYVKDYAGNTFWSKRMIVVLKETRLYKLRQFLKTKLRSAIAVFFP